MSPISRLLTIGLLAVAGVAQADPPERDTEREYRRHLASVREYLPLRPLRAAMAYLQAIKAKPDGWEALAALSMLLREHGATLVREAYRVAPDEPRVRALATARLGRLPQIKRFGRATRLEALYLARSFHDLTYDRAPSMLVGQQLDRRRLIVHGIDASGDLVPVDLTFELGDGLAREGEAIVARAASKLTTLVVRDRKTGLSAKVAIRLLGPPATIEPTVGRAKAGPNELLHFRASISDAAGNPLWVRRLLWRARGAAGEELSTALKMRGYSRVHEDVSYEQHLNSMHVPEQGGYRGPVTVTVIEPMLGASGAVTVTLGRRAAHRDRQMGEISWVDGWDAGQAAARERDKPLMVYLHADW